MAKKSNVTPSEIEKWMSRIKRAESVRDKADERYGFGRSILEYQGDYASAIPTFVANVDIVPINEVYAFVKAFIPSVYSRDPHIAVNPKGMKSIAASKILELSTNSYWRDLRLKREIKRAMFDACFAEGWIKSGFTAEIGKDDEAPVESSEFIKSEEIFATRVSWRNMVRDPDAVNGIHDSRWVAQNIIKPLEIVKASSLYENTKSLTPSIIDTWRSETKQRANVYQDEVEYVSLWEVWDRDNGKVFTIADTAHDYLMNKKWPYEMDGFPYCLLRFNENPDEPYAPNLIMSWEPQLWEKIKVRAMQLDHLKRFGRQLICEEGALSSAEESKFIQGRTGSIIKHKKGKTPPIPIAYPQIQSDMYAVENRIDLDKDNVSGQPNAVRSAPQKTQSRTLGEIDRLIAAFQARQSEPQSVIEDFSAEVAYKLIALQKQFLTMPRFVRATQKDAAEIAQALIDPVTGQSRYDGNGFTFTKSDIQDAEFEIDVKAGSTLPLDKESRMERLTALLKLGPTIGIQPGGLVARTIGKNFMTELEMPEVEQAYDEEMRQIENQKIMARAAQAGSLEVADAQIQNIHEAIADIRAGGPA